MNHKEYWRERARLLEEAQNRQGRECYAEVERQYREAQRAIEGKIASWYQRFADNNGITMQQAKQMLKDKELEEFRWEVNDYIRHGKENARNGAWMEQLENASARAHINRLESLKLQIQQSLESMFGNQLDSVDSTMRNIYKDSYYKTAYEIQKGIGVGWDFASIDERKIEKVVKKPWAPDGRNFSERIWGNRQKLVNELHTELSRNIIMGEDPQKAINAIARKMKTSQNVAGRLVMTESAFFSSAAQKECYQELDVEQYEIVATLDSHTSELCREMDGKHFPMSQYEAGVTAPPFHVYCRSCTCPYFDDEFDRIGKRAARKADGKVYYVPGDMTYKEWQKAFVEGEKDGLTHVKENDILTLDECKSVDEVEALFKKQDWFIHGTGKLEGWRSDESLSLKGCDLECAKGIYRSYEQVLYKFPQLKNKFAAVSAARLKKDTYAQCTMGSGNGLIEVNTLYFSDINKVTKDYIKDVKAGFHTANTSAFSIITHELGHSIDDYLTNTLGIAGKINGKPRYVSSKMRSKVMSACNLTVRGRDVKEHVSEYATQNQKEWFAECFAEYMCSDHPRAVATEFGKQLEELMKEVK